MTSQWGIHLLHATWQAGAVAMLAIAYGRLVRSARLRHALLLIALIKFALPPMLPLPFGIFSAAPRVGSAELWTVERYLVVGQSPWSSMLAPLMMLHLAGAVFVALYRISVAVRGHLALRRCAAITDPQILHMAARIAARMRLKRVPRLLVSSEITVPCVTSALRPAIVLPARMGDGDLRGVLLHEMAHIRGRDLVVAWAEALLSIGWWWNPLFWLLEAELGRAREERCDDLAMLHGAEPRRYSLSLIDFARASAPRTAAIGIADHRSALERRLRRIADDAVPRQSRLTALQVAIVIVALLLLLPGLQPNHWPHIITIERHP
jgi:beta-lactamase regulating signal transducer with metallopeptidase domain